MTDREKAIRGLECCTNRDNVGACANCPYSGKITCDVALWRDVRALIEEGQITLQVRGE